MAGLERATVRNKRINATAAKYFAAFHSYLSICLISICLKKLFLSGQDAYSKISMLFIASCIFV